ncbi:DNA/RNA non-specific endonuclease [Anthocerotibacter panamensis]|uniref:DNA/RNA non-specific endonuclease n=1 Tax=Anthocerotibacter panamensis TaxID=2857077 RepID=UPI001C40471D|nr:DNA/RNA non-specific endonuclease [Anthocerotibacter panamensis]
MPSARHPLLLFFVALALAACASPRSSRLRCTDFKSAKEVAQAYKDGATYLDADGDGYACKETFNVYVLRKKPRRKADATTASIVPTTPAEVLALGNPSGATPDNPDNYLMVKPQYTLSYNRTKGIPNWVAWQLNQSWIGQADRQNDFRPDDTLPQGFYAVTPSDYTGTGYDRGHQCPSADRTRSPADNSATFFMTNMIPQTPDLNRGPWEKLESYSRDLAAQGKELYIIAGVTGEKETIDGGRISVPARNWKVVVVLDRPGLGLQGVTAKTRIIAVDMPNTLGIRNNNWTQYRVAVDQIEKATGYDLLAKVPKDIQRGLERKVDP